MAPVAQKEYFYQWPYTVFGDSFKNVLILGAGSGTDVAAALMHGAEHVDAVEIDPTILRLGREPASRSSVRRSARHGHQRRRPPLPADDEQEVRPRRLCADRFADAAVELLGRAARELHVHRGVVPRGPRPPRRRTACWSSTTTSARSGWSIGWRTPRPSPSAPSRGCTCTRRAPISASCSPGPRLATLTTRPGRSGQVTAYNQSHAPSPARMHRARRVDRSRRPTTGRSSICRTATSRSTTSSRSLLILVGVGGIGPVGAARPGRRLVVAVLLPRRRVHAARDEGDHPVRAAVGLDLGRRVAGDRRRC